MTARDLLMIFAGALVVANLQLHRFGDIASAILILACLLAAMFIAHTGADMLLGQN